MRGTLSDGAQIVNSVYVQANEPDPNLGNNLGDALTIVGAQADLAVLKMATPNPATAGGILNYAIEVRNLGPDAAEAVVVTDVLPSVLFGLGADSAQVTLPTGTGTCEFLAADRFRCALGTIAPNDSRVLAFSVVLPAGATTLLPGGVLTNTVTTKSRTGDPNPKNNTFLNPVQVLSAADLRIEKRAEGAIRAGEPLTYTLQVANLGPSDARAVQVVDELPGGVTLLATNPAATVVSRTLTWSIGDLKAWGALRHRRRGPCQCGPGRSHAAGEFSSHFQPDAGPQSGNNQAKATTQVFGLADVGLTKEVQYETVPSPARRSPTRSVSTTAVHLSHATWMSRNFSRLG